MYTVYSCHVFNRNTLGTSCSRIKCVSLCYADAVHFSLNRHEVQEMNRRSTDEHSQSLQNCCSTLTISDTGHCNPMFAVFRRSAKMLKLQLDSNLCTSSSGLPTDPLSVVVSVVSAAAAAVRNQHSTVTIKKIN